MKNYPYYGKHNNGRVVRFTGPSTGTVVEIGTGGSFEVGFESNKWDEKFYTEFDYEVKSSEAVLQEMIDDKNVFVVSKDQEGVHHIEVTTAVKETTMSTTNPLTKGGIIIGGIKKDTGICSIGQKPEVHADFETATAEAERLAAKDPNKKFVLLQVLGICSANEIVWE